MGLIEEVGSDVTSLKVGDRVVMPFNVACDFRKNCLGGFTGFRVHHRCPTPFASEGSTPSVNTTTW